MPLPEEHAEGYNRNRNIMLSEGHNPPRFVDKRLPTFELQITADGGPGKTAFRAAGTNPWILGSLTLGTNKVWLIDYMNFNAGSPNMWFKIRHSHSGTANIPGGTLDSYYIVTRGNVVVVGGPDQPLLAIRGPGTVFLLGFGAGSVAGTSSNRVHRALGTRAIDRFAGKIRGYVV